MREPAPDLESDHGLDATLAALDRIVASAAATDSALGIFPAMYRSVTEVIRDAVHAGYFDRCDTMERLAMAFADRYLDAYSDLQNGTRATESWQVAFDAAQDGKPRMILQHLLAGMNAHINLDLGIVAADVAGDEPETLYADFLRVNEILFLQIDDLQARLGEVSPRMVWIDRLGWRFDETLMRLGIREARDDAWDLASRLLAHPENRAELIAARDRSTARLGRAILDGRPHTRVLIRAVAHAEVSSIHSTVEALSATQLDLDRVENSVASRLDDRRAGAPDPRS